MSRFVSGGTTEQPTERDEAWLKAQQELDAKHLAAAEASQQAGSGKSLYETLQANKAAKQDAFEESLRLRNQFRSLDEDEVEFLDAVAQGSRARERAVREETRERLEAFRRRQLEEAAVESGDRDGDGDGEPPVAVESWRPAQRKRKKGREREGLGGVKVRRTSAAVGGGDDGEEDGEKVAVAVPASAPGTDVAVERNVEGPGVAGGKASDDETAGTAESPVTAKAKDPAAPSPAPAPALVAYSSDEED